MAKNPFSIKQRLLSFKHAINGWRLLIKEEHNAWIHTAVATAAIGLGFYQGISKVEWIALIICISLVFSLELINTAIENLCDLVSPEQHPLIKKVKDLAAGAVLVGALAAAVVGVLIFWG